ncbi:histidine kinase/response regulator receiver domain-containing protein [Desulfocapsa sulfexigens DSM 10523]|uniref:histidine kinase n=1 Tax=Desulfocapsa sulfexigens (strain DSM 10523 / SB164P1) TaxID=1167006 RepID=M1ND05_DESSD|nr:response regulator [Desulfocapsa sulfexigens]AGF77639.1 histidine kinase/response regulator receiver domain-containing protein [Desulfocapsa sulfexigens DSM 10523]
MNQQPVILCVDNEPINLSLMEAVLAPQGFLIVLAQDGKTALDRLHSERVDLVLMDVMMPEMDGFEVCRRIKADSATWAIPVLFVSSLNDSSFEIMGLELGAADYLVKPFSPAVLQARVKTQLEIKAHSDLLEELAAERARQLIHAERLSTLGTLAAGIAHEINNPLSYIFSYAQMLLTDMQKLKSLMTSHGVSETALRRAWQDFLEQDAEAPVNIAEGANRILVIMESIRKFSCQGQREKVPVSMVVCIENALSLCNNALKYHVTVDKKLAPGLDPVIANGQQLEQVFVNLFKNAADAMDAKKKGTLSITLDQANGFIRCTVEDNGPGIEPQQLEAIWQPFFTTKDAQTGTGLGLSISRGIIEEHQGRILAENREDVQGARFVVELPVRSTKQ